MSNTIQLKRSSTASDTPTASDLAVGELAVNTADAKLFTKHTDNSIKEISSGSGGGGSGLSNVVEDTTPQLGGDLQSNEKAIKFADSGDAVKDRLFFGNSNDLSLYHDGSNSRITQNGTGSLYISTNNDTIFYADGYAKLIVNDTDSGGVKLYYGNGTLTAQTTSEGLDVETGILNLKNTGSQSEIRMYCESSNAHYAALKAPAHSAFSGDVDLTLPATTGTLALTSGNVFSATKLQYARTIAGVSFDGTANIGIASTNLSDASSINADTVDSKHISVVDSLPSSPDSNTIYFVTS